MKPVMVAALLVAMSANSPGQTTQQSGGQIPGRRIAIVIGNHDYSKLAALPAVPREMELMRGALESANFKVTRLENASLDDLAKALDTFTAEVQPGDVCFVYYSGYAVQDGVDDFLLPVDFNPSTRGSLRNLAYPVTFLTQNIEARKAAIKMFFVEGARRIDANIPDTRPGLRLPDTRYVTEVLFGIPAREQILDTPPDTVGLFTDALARMIKTDTPIAEVMPKVLKEVMEKSKRQQEPAYDNKITQTFYFHAPKIQAPVETRLEFPQNRIDREEYAWIPAGTFEMGCVPSDTKCDNNEKPRHSVTLSKGFWMGRNEVRVSSFRRFVADDPTKKRKMPAGVDWNRKWQNDSHPISNMSWEAARDYCSWAGGRLPTEAEWEYADRGGVQGEIFPFKLDESRDKANFYGQSGGKDIWDTSTAPVRSFDANPYGLFDMAGNVWEFVNDWFAKDYYASSPAVDPQGPATGQKHVRRGGSFYSDAKQHLRISYREGSNPENNVGFRCVMDDTSKARDILQLRP